MKAIEEDDMEMLQSGESAADSMVALPDKVDLVDLIEQPAWKTILTEKERWDVLVYVRQLEREGKEREAKGGK